MKKEWETLASGAGKAARGLIDSAIQAADRNDDGKVDLADVSALAETVGASVKKGAQTVKESAGERAQSLERRSLRPIFPEQLGSADFSLPRLIRVVERSGRYARSAVCRGAIGFESEAKGLRIVNLFRDAREAFGLRFYPDGDRAFYYQDPVEPGQYVALGEYFDYLKLARVNELRRIAQELGAKHFRICYCEEQSASAGTKVAAKVKAETAAKAAAEHGTAETRRAALRVEAEMELAGHAPVRPQLKYLRSDPLVQELIAMRMKEGEAFLHDRQLLKLSQSSGMEEADAVKIDAMLKGLHCSADAHVTGEARSEAGRYLEYEIDF